MVTFTFQKVSEKKPVRGQNISYIDVAYSFSMYGFEPKNCTVEYDLVQIDEEGNDTGNSACYDPEELPKNMQIGDVFNGYELRLVFNGYYPTEDTLWMDSETFFDIIDKEMAN